jgi:hypothetical protein
VSHQCLTVLFFLDMGFFWQFEVSLGTFFVIFIQISYSPISFLIWDSSYYYDFTSYSSVSSCYWWEQHPQGTWSSVLRGSGTFKRWGLNQ